MGGNDLKKYNILIFAISFLLLIGGCGSKPVSDKQMLDDIPTDFITIRNDNVETEFKLRSFDIEKRKTDDDQDDIYGVISMENDEMEFSASCYLQYNYYDQGGWVLDECRIIDDKYEIKPLEDADKNRADNVMAEYYEKYSLVENSVNCLDDKYVSNYIYDVSQDGEIFSYEG